MREDGKMTKKPFLKAKYRELKQISAKAVVVKSYDGEDLDPMGEDYIYSDWSQIEAELKAMEKNQ